VLFLLASMMMRLSWCGCISGFSCRRRPSASALWREPGINEVRIALFDLFFRLHFKSQASAF
jgi:hypothetical protein